MYNADTIFDDFKGLYGKLWVCPECHSIHIFSISNPSTVSCVYIPIQNRDILTNVTDKKYILFEDILWDTITDLTIPTIEIPKYFSPTYYANQYNNYLVLFKQEQAEKPIKTYIKLEVKD